MSPITILFIEIFIHVIPRWDWGVIDRVWKTDVNQTKCVTSSRWSAADVKRWKIARFETFTWNEWDRLGTRSSIGNPTQVLTGKSLQKTDNLEKIPRASRTNRILALNKRLPCLANRVGHFCQQDTWVFHFDPEYIKIFPFQRDGPTSEPNNSPRNGQNSALFSWISVVHHPMKASLPTLLRPLISAWFPSILWRSH
jgi:hypothetical protein